MTRPQLYSQKCSDHSETTEFIKHLIRPFPKNDPICQNIGLKAQRGVSNWELGLQDGGCASTLPLNVIVVSLSQIESTAQHLTVDVLLRCFSARFTSGRSEQHQDRQREVSILLFVLLLKLVPAFPAPKRNRTVWRRAGIQLPDQSE